MRPGGLTGAPKSDAHDVIDNGAPTRIAGRDHGRRRQWLRYQARRVRGRVRRGLLAALALLALAACSPATTRRLCDVSEVALDVAKPETPSGKTAAGIGRLLRAILCPRLTPQAAPVL